MSNLVSLLAGTVLAAACVHTPTIYAQRDYDQFPAQKAEIAFSNVRRILQDRCTNEKQYPRCTGSSVTAEQLSFNGVNCISWERRVLPGSTPTIIPVCSQEQGTQFSFPYREVEKIVPGEYDVKVCLANGDCHSIFSFVNPRQADEFAEALNIICSEQK